MDFLSLSLLGPGEPLFLKPLAACSPSVFYVNSILIFREKITPHVLPECAADWFLIFNSFAVMGKACVFFPLVAPPPKA